MTKVNDGLVLEEYDVQILTLKNFLVSPIIIEIYHALYFSATDLLIGHFAVLVMVFS